MPDVPVPQPDLKKVVRYIVKLKKWLKKEYDWQRKITAEVNRLSRKVGGSGGPTPIRPPPPPPFKP